MLRDGEAAGDVHVGIGRDDDLGIDDEARGERLDLTCGRAFGERRGDDQRRVADAGDGLLDVEDVDEPVVARRLREHRLDRHLDDGGAGEILVQRRRLGATLDEDECLGGVARSGRQHLVVAVVGEGEVLGVLDGERAAIRLAGGGFGGGTGRNAAKGGKCGAERQGSLEHGRRLLASRCCAELHRAVSWLPDRRSLPTFQPHSAVVSTPSPSRRRGEFTSRSQLRDSPGFAPAFPLGSGDATADAVHGPCACAC